MPPFPHPLIEPDMQLSRIRLSDKSSHMWLRGRGDSAALRRTQQLAEAIRTTRRKFFEPTDVDLPVAEALIVADGLREAARHCQEGQAALHARLVGGAETIERLCRSREAQS